MNSVHKEKPSSQKRTTVVGGGAVGLNVASRLAISGQHVSLFTRRPEAAKAFESQGLRLVDPARNQECSARRPKARRFRKSRNESMADLPPDRGD